MTTTPFPNTYISRLVAAMASKSCSVCYKPTTTVLVASNNADFFYICENHLKDKSFAEPIQPKEYQLLIKEKLELETDLRGVNKKASSVKPYSWNKVISNFSWESAQLEQQKDNNDKNTKDTEQKDSSQKENGSYEELVKESNDLDKKLAKLNESIASFKFKNYKLNPSVYKMRLNSHLQAQVRLRRQQEVQTPGFFPQAPTHLLT